MKYHEAKLLVIPLLTEDEQKNDFLIQKITDKVHKKVNSAIQKAYKDISVIFEKHNIIIDEKVKLTIQAHMAFYVLYISENSIENIIPYLHKNQ